MNILVINAGSSSLKFQLLQTAVVTAQLTKIRQSSGKNMDGNTPGFICIYKGIVDGIGTDKSVFKATFGNKNITTFLPATNHKDALQTALKIMLKRKIVKSLKKINAIGHRVVHGGEKYQNAAIIDNKLIKIVRRLSSLAPLHNPPNLKAILACKKLLPDTAQVAVFDTAFHATMPKKAFLYALPYYFYAKLGIRRYGFHGTSHAYVSQKALQLLKKKNSKIVVCHLGNGSSVTAIKNGKSIDTSMGFTPLEGIPMGTRSGDIDPAIIFFLMKKLKASAAKIETILTRESGLKGLSELSSDVRDLWAAAQKNNAKAIIALEILAYRTAKYIGAYAAAMNGLDAIVFTAGIGENAWYLRQNICNYFSFLRVKINSRRNKKNAEAIHTNKSRIKIFVIPTDEERQIAIETFRNCYGAVRMTHKNTP